MPPPVAMPGTIGPGNGLGGGDERLATTGPSSIGGREGGIGTTADESRQREHFVEAHALPLPHRVAVATDLVVHRFTEAKPLVAQFMHQFGIELRLGRIDGFYGLEQCQGKPSIKRCAGKRQRRFSGKRGAGKPAIDHRGHGKDANAVPVAFTSGSGRNPAEYPPQTPLAYS